MIPAYNKKRCAAVPFETGIHFRRKTDLFPEEDTQPGLTRDSNLNPLSYKPRSLVYADKPQTLDHLEDNIRCVIADIRPQMLEKVIENWTSRLDHIRASRGSPMPEIIFKM
ncbi:hypothetical protein TNCV_1576461 [Trichonephila clavipes]|nr:hypothetical protein TNCV_1576461 [Trichonephila clavipes]